MRDETEERKKQARSNKQQGKATQYTQGSHMYMYIHVECHGFKFDLRQLIFLRKSDCLGCAVLLCLVVCLTLLASFFLPSHLSHHDCTRSSLETCSCRFESKAVPVFLFQALSTVNTLSCLALCSLCTIYTYTVLSCSLLFMYYIYIHSKLFMYYIYIHSKLNWFDSRPRQR